MPAKKKRKKAAAEEAVSERKVAALEGAKRRRKGAKKHGKRSHDEDSGSWLGALRDEEPSRGNVKKVLERGPKKIDKLLESAMTWVVKLAIRAKALYDMLEAWWKGKYDLPSGTLQALLVALLYFISPLDLIPDVLPLFGLMDDAAVFAFVISRIREDLEDFAKSTGKSPADLGL